MHPPTPAHRTRPIAGRIRHLEGSTAAHLSPTDTPIRACWTRLTFLQFEIMDMEPDVEDRRDGVRETLRGEVSFATFAHFGPEPSRRTCAESI
jgi:hypothetical protein